MSHPVTKEQLMDTASLQQAHEALHKNEEVLRKIIDSTEDGILVVNDKGQVTHCNARFQEMWHIPEEIMKLGIDIELLYYVYNQLEEPYEFLQKVQRLLQTKEECFDTLLFKDGRVFERFSRPLLKESEITGRI